MAGLDLGGASVAWQPTRPPLHGLAVVAPSRLGTTAIHYRLLYTAPPHSGSYRESRWTAHPAELLEQALNRRFAATAGGCRLELELDEWVQLFDTPQTSRSLLAVRASLLSPGRDAVLAARSLSLEQAAPSADAFGGAQAAGLAVQALARALGQWLAQADNPSLTARCGGA